MWEMTHGEVRDHFRPSDHARRKVEYVLVSEALKTSGLRVAVKSIKWA